MELKYIDAFSAQKPPSVEIQKTTVYFRKDFEQTELFNGCAMWKFKEATMSIAEFNVYASNLILINAAKGINDSEKISQIVETGSDSNNNQLIVMEAMADLYDAIAELYMMIDSLKTEPTEEGGTEE